jgi:hypothetical protein
MVNALNYLTNAKNEGIITYPTMTFIILVILHSQLAISTSLLFAVKGYKVEYYTLIDASSEKGRKKDTPAHLSDFCY